ncbi:AMP-binding protein [Rhodococcus qingshengii]|uniref:AMP-binding protein n=1 Tax=Rhodococcus qingshengii TaxID=334542 RepID=UPI0035F9D00B
MTSTSAGDITEVELNSVLFDLLEDARGWVRDSSNNSCGYSQLIDSVRSTSAKLQDRFTPQQDIIVVTVGRTLSSLTLILSCVQAGIVFIPLDRAVPEQRVLTIAAMSGAAAVITDRDDLLGDQYHRVSSFVVATVGGTNQQTKVAVGDTLCILFTSGSTGIPKGVVCSRSGFAHRVKNDILNAPEYEAGPEDTLVARASLSFIMALAEVFTALRHRTNLFLASDAEIRNPPLLAKRIEENGGTIILGVPSLLEAMMRTNGCLPRSLRIVLVGGESCNKWLTGALQETQKSIHVIHTYGNTESSANVFYSPSLQMLGDPLPGMAGVVLGDDLMSVGAGGVGELYLVGPQLASGYFGRVALTAERFVPCPLVPGEVMFRTGDLVRVGTDGGFSYVGRSDFQLNVRGHRVEPGEIECAATALDGVENCVVLERSLEQSTGSLSLVVAFVTESVSSAVDPDEVRAALGSRLPDYMVPNRVVVVGAIPLTASGKVDRPALAKIPLNQGLSDLSGSDLERAVCDVFSEVLQCGQVGRSDDFFELGGHSLAAIALSETIGARTGLYLEPTAIFTERTPAKLSAILAGAQGDVDRPLPDEYVAQKRTPLTSSEASLWFTQRYRDTKGAFNLWYYGDVRGDLDAHQFRRAIERAVEIHQNLRFTVEEGFEGPVKSLVEPERIGEYNYLRMVEGAVPDERVRELIDQDFDLLSELPIRVTLFTDPGTTSLRRVLVVINHVAADGASMPALVDTVRAVLEERAGTASSPAAVLPSRLVGDARTADKAFWLRYLSAVTTDPGRGTRPNRTKPRSYVGRSIELSLDQITVDRLNRVAGAVGGTLFTVLHGVVALTLTATGFGTSSLVTVPVENRHSSSDRAAVGMIANNLLLKSSIDFGQSLDAYLKALARSDIEALGHQRFPLEDAVGILREGDGTDHRVDLPIAMALQKDHQNHVALNGASLDRIRLPISRCPYDLYFNFLQHPAREGITLELQYATDIYDESAIMVIANAVRRFSLIIPEDLERISGSFLAVEL